MTEEKIKGSDIECSKCGFQTVLPERLVGCTDYFECPTCGEVKFYYVIKGKKAKK